MRFLKTKTEHEIVAIPSGDHESFCFDVSRDEWIKLLGKEPDKYDKSWFNKGYYRVYLQELFPILSGITSIDQDHNLIKFTISIKSEVVDNVPRSDDSQDSDFDKWRDKD